jgi:hypothetical protein
MTNLNKYLDNKKKFKSALLGTYLLENLRLRFGLLVVIVGLLWFAKKIEWFASDIFAPMLVLTLGVWFILSYLLNKLLNKYNNWISSLDIMQDDFDGL